MSVRDFIDFLGHRPIFIVVFLAGVPALAIIWSLLHRREASASMPWKLGYSILAYLSCIPGMLSAVLLAYAVFFIHENLLDVNFLVYVAPLLSMVACLIIIRRRIAFGELPGFGRLSGLMTLLAVSMGLALAIDRTRIFVGFFGSIDHLLILVAGLFIVLKASFWLAFGRGKRD